MMGARVAASCRCRRRRCHPKPLRIYRHAGFAVYARCTVSF